MESTDLLGRTDPYILALLRGLDVDYRIRRLRFVVRKLNGFYHFEPESGLPPPDTEALDHMKGLFYDQIDHLGWRWKELFFFGSSCRGMAAQLVSDLAAGRPTSRDQVVQLVASLTQMMGLADLDRLHDELFFAETARELLDKERHASLLRAYIGFGFYDLITFPVLQRNDFSEVTEILVDRISPRDADSLYTEGSRPEGQIAECLRGFLQPWLARA
ncbi:hypothetical protein QW131_11500 [Roseibium salinum]|nr:hypothetical protein [Roseibium salinum]